ncbi:MAG: Gfo/Idh/MocA family oxidoreductase, partial [Candidatus Bathyarchaeia archaeon]
MIYCRLRSSGGGRESMVVKVGVIGCGAALEKHHLPAIRDLPGVKVKALADVNERRIEKVVRKFGLRDVETYTDHRQLLKCANIDAVWILTPPETHAHMIIDAIGHGKHVLCEKPIAMSTKEAKLVKDALEQNIWSRRLILMPAHNFIFTPCFEGAVEYVKREGLIGEVKEIYGRAISNLLFYKAVTDFRLRAKGGVAEDLLPHVIYLSQDLCGRVKRIRFVSPHSEGQSITEDIDVEVEFDGGAKGVLSAAWSSSIPYFKFSIKGSSGSIFMDLLRTPFTLTLVKDGEKKTIHFGRRFTQYLDVLVGNHPSYRNEHAHFVNVIEGLEELRVNVDDGLNLSRTLELIVDAIEERPKVTVRHNERVSIVKFDGNLEASVRRAIELLGGLNVPRDAKVVIKPNVCFWKNANGMIITDPRLLEAVLKIVKERTSRITVVESDNNSGTAEKRLEKSGVMDIVKR